MNKENKKILVGSDDINLFTALSVFISKAPKFIDRIIDAAETNDLLRVEELAAKLSICSNVAQLAGFAERAKEIIVAAREQKPATIKKLAVSMQAAFEQIVNLANSTAFNQAAQLEQQTAIFSNE